MLNMSKSIICTVKSASGKPSRAQITFLLFIMAVIQYFLCFFMSDNVCTEKSFEHYGLEYRGDSKPSNLVGPGLEDPESSDENRLPIPVAYSARTARRLASMCEAYLDLPDYYM